MARRVHSSYNANRDIAKRTSGAFFEESLEAERPCDTATGEEYGKFDWEFEAVIVPWVSPGGDAYFAELLVGGEVFGSDGAEMLQGVVLARDDEG